MFAAAGSITVSTEPPMPPWTQLDFDRAGQIVTPPLDVIRSPRHDLLDADRIDQVHKFRFAVGGLQRVAIAADVGELAVLGGFQRKIAARIARVDQRREIVDRAVGVENLCGDRQEDRQAGTARCLRSAPECLG